MNHDISEQMMVVLLDEIVQHTLPRILAIRNKLSQGERVFSSELEFFSETLSMVNRCDRDYPQDPECAQVFARLSHLLSEVIELAHKNEHEGFSADMKVEV